MALKPDQKVLLDVCCGRWGWSKEFAKRDWTCIGIDLLEHETAPEGCKLIRMNLLALTVEMLRKWGVTFAVASTPCEEFACWNMKHFQPNAPRPDLGIKLFKHIEGMCVQGNIPFIMENVRAAQEFIGESVHNAGPFHLWGNAVPLILPQGFKKGLSFKRRDGRYGGKHTEVCELMYGDKKLRKQLTATIPPELAACVADYAERILEMKYAQKASNVSPESVRASVTIGDIKRFDPTGRITAAED